MKRLWIMALCLISPPALCLAEVKVETAMVLMRDMVRLATDVYRDPAVTKAPVVLMRTPYNKDGGAAAARRFAEAGYVAVVQDCRG
jgi:predicted acyl esterase